MRAWRRVFGPPLVLRVCMYVWSGLAWGGKSGVGIGISGRMVDASELRVACGVGVFLVA